MIVSAGGRWCTLPIKPNIEKWPQKADRFRHGWLFRILIGLSIVFTCLSMGIAPSNFPERVNASAPTSPYWWLTVMDIFAVIVFILEIILKVVDLGWEQYIKSPWNRLNTFTVLCAILDLTAPQGNPWVSLLRACRVLRALRVLKWFQSFKLVLRAFVGGWTYLVHVCALLCFFFFVAGIVGIEQFSGATRQRCTLPTGALLELPSHEPAAYCDIRQTGLASGLNCKMLGNALNLTAVCTTLSESLEGAGYLHFDHAAGAVFSSFIIASVESWATISYWLLDAVSPFSIIYGIGVILFVNWLVFNMFVSVICGLFSSSWAAYEREQKKRRRRLILRQAAAASRALLQTLADGAARAPIESGSPYSPKRSSSPSSSHGSPAGSHALQRNSAPSSPVHRFHSSTARTNSSVQLAAHYSSTSDQAGQHIPGDAGSSPAQKAMPPLTEDGSMPPPKMSHLGSVGHFDSKFATQNQSRAQGHDTPLWTSSQTIHGTGTKEEQEQLASKSSDLLWAELKSAVKGIGAFRKAMNVTSQCQRTVGSSRCVISVRRFMVQYKKESLIFDWVTIGLVTINFVATLTSLGQTSDAGLLWALRFQAFVNLFAVLEVVLRTTLDGLAWFKSLQHSSEALLVACGASGAVAFIADGHFSGESPVSRVTRLAMILPIFRILRLVAALGLFPSMQAFLLMIKRASNALLTIVAINVYIVFLCAVIAMQVIGRRPLDNDASDIQKGMTFDSFAEACFTLFAVGSGETWTDIAFASIRKSGIPGGVLVTAFYLMCALIMLPLLVANIVTSVSIGEEERKRNQAISFVRHWKRVRHQKLQEIRQISLRAKQEQLHADLGGPAAAEVPAALQLDTIAHRKETDSSSVDSAWLEATSLPSVFLNVDPVQDAAMRTAFHITVSEYEQLVRARFRSLAKRLIYLQRFGGLQGFAKRLRHTNAQASLAVKPNKHTRRLSKPIQASALAARMPDVPGFEKVKQKVISAQQCAGEQLYKLWWGIALFVRAHEGYALGCISPNHPLRKLCIAIDRSFAFSAFNVATIGAFVAVVSLRDALATSSLLQALNLAESCLATCFCIECLIRIVHHGAIFTEHAYVLTGWGALDCLTALAALMCTFPVYLTSDQHLHAFSAKITVLNIVRTIRLGRITSVLQKLDTTSELLRSMQQAGRELLFGCLVLLVVLLVFAMIGTTIFGGQMESCSDASITTAHECVGLFFVDGLTAAPRSWGPQVSHFDNAWSAVETLFEVMTLEGFVDVALETKKHTVLATWSTLYFVVFLTVTSFVLLQFLVGTVLGNISDADGASTQMQGEWVNILAYINQLSPHMPIESLASVIQGQVAHFFESHKFTKLLTNSEDSKEKNESKTRSALESHANLKRMVSNESLFVAGRHGAPLFGKMSNNDMSRASSISSIGASNASFQWNLNPFCCKMPNYIKHSPSLQAYAKFARDISVPCDTDEAACSAKGRRYHFMHKYFEQMVALNIVCHSVLLLSNFNSMADVWHEAWRWLRFCAVLLFAAELAIRLGAEGLKHFCRSKLNMLDSVAVVSGLVAIPFADGALLGKISRVILCLRVLRLMLLSPALHILLDTLAHSFKAIASVTAILATTVVVYALAGMELFGHMGPQHAEHQPATTTELSFNWLLPSAASRAFSPQFQSMYNASGTSSGLNVSSVDLSSEGHTEPYEALGRHVHFQTAFNAILTMFRASTGEDWQNIFHDIRREHPIASRIFFFSFLLLCGQVLLNYFLAVVILRFDRCWSLVRGQVTYADLVRFQKIWFNSDFSGGSEFMTFNKTKRLVKAFAQDGAPNALQRARAVYHGADPHDDKEEGDGHSEMSDNEHDMPAYSPTAAAELELPFHAMLAQAAPGLKGKRDEDSILREQAMQMAMSGVLRSSVHVEEERTRRSSFHPGMNAGLGALRMKAQGLKPVAVLTKQASTAAPISAPVQRRSTIFQSMTSAVAEAANAVTSYVAEQIESTAGKIAEQATALRDFLGGEQQMTEFQANTLVGLQSRLWWSLVREDLRDAAVTTTAHLMLMAHKAQQAADNAHNKSRAKVVPVTMSAAPKISGTHRKGVRAAAKAVTAAAIFRLGIHDSFRREASRPSPTHSAAIVRGSTMSHNVVQLRAMRREQARAMGQPVTSARRASSRRVAPPPNISRRLSSRRLVNLNSSTRGGLGDDTKENNELAKYVEAAAELPDTALLIPFQAVITSLALWHIGPEALQPHEALQRAMSIKRWHQHIVVSRIQAHWRRIRAKRAVARRLDALVASLGAQIRLQRCARHIQSMWVRHKHKKLAIGAVSRQTAMPRDAPPQLGVGHQERKRSSVVELPPLVLPMAAIGQKKVHAAPLGGMVAELDSKRKPAAAHSPPDDPSALAAAKPTTP